MVNCIHWLVNAINSLTTFIRKVALTFRIINKSADVIVIDAEAFDSLVNCIPENVSYEVLPVRNKKELLKKFSISFFIHLFVVRMRSSKRSFNSVALTALIKTYHPKVILTYIDNSSTFSNISNYLKKYKFLSVQNGTRWDLSFPDQPNLYFGNYYSFGLCEKDILNKGEHRFDSINPVGSIKLGIFLEQLKPQLGIERICIISEWISQLSFHDSKHDTDLDEIYTNAERDMFRLVDEYAHKRNLPIVIAARSKEDSDLFDQERTFFLENARSVVVVKPRTAMYSSYELAYFSSLVVTLGSSLGYEMLGVGKKVMFAIDFKGPTELIFRGVWDKNYVTHRLPDELRLLDNSKEANFNKMDCVLHMSEESYERLTAEARNYYMNINKNFLPQVIIRNDIHAILLIGNSSPNPRRHSTP